MKDMKQKEENKASILKSKTKYKKKLTGLQDLSILFYTIDPPEKNKTFIEKVIDSFSLKFK